MVTLRKRAARAPARDPQRLFSEEQKEQMWRRQNGKCYKCRQVLINTLYHAHHKKAWSEGGPTTVGNGALLCLACHVFVHAAHRPAGSVAGSAGGAATAEPQPSSMSVQHSSANAYEAERDEIVSRNKKRMRCDGARVLWTKGASGVKARVNLQYGKKCRGPPP